MQFFTKFEYVCTMFMTYYSGKKILHAVIIDHSQLYKMDEERNINSLITNNLHTRGEVYEITFIREFPGN